jgi:hypothetical protein
MLTLNGPGLKIGMKWTRAGIFGTKNMVGGVTINRHIIFGRLILNLKVTVLDSLNIYCFLRQIN